jgi:hypothetical protein
VQGVGMRIQIPKAVDPRLVGLRDPRLMMIPAVLRHGEQNPIASDHTLVTKNPKQLVVQILCGLWFGSHAGREEAGARQQNLLRMIDGGKTKRHYAGLSEEMLQQIPVDWGVQGRPALKDRWGHRN